MYNNVLFFCLQVRKRIFRVNKRGDCQMSFLKIINFIKIVPMPILLFSRATLSGPDLSAAGRRCLRVVRDSPCLNYGENGEKKAGNFAGRRQRTREDLRTGFPPENCQRYNSFVL